MDRDEYFAIKSEIKELEALLAEIPKTNKLERMGLEDRLHMAKAAIEGMKEERLPYKATLTFQGKPVFGARGATAEFLNKASNLFSEAVTAVASGLDDDLKSKGPVPEKHKNQLILVGVAKGSFGFQYELPVSAEQDFFTENKVEKSLELVRDLFEYSAQRSDDDVAELVGAVNPRGTKKIAAFLKHVSDHEAWCAVSFKNRSFRYKNLEEISKASSRLQEGNIHESEVELEGELQGCLPDGRAFEFIRQDTKEILKGRIGLDIGSPSELNSKYLLKPVKIRLHVTQVGKGKPRYMLVSLEDINLQ